MLHRRLALLGLIVGLLAMFATVALANILTKASTTANCKGYSLTVDAE